MLENRYIKKYHITTKMKSANVKPRTYISLLIEGNEIINLGLMIMLKY